MERRKAQGVWCHMAAPSLGQDDRGQKSEVGGQRSEGRRQKIEILLWERLSRPPRLSESDGGQAAAIGTTFTTLTISTI